jgi:hypothetical protein
LFVVTIILLAFVIVVMLVHVIRAWRISLLTATEQPIDGYQNVEQHDEPA